MVATSAIPTVKAALASVLAAAWPSPVWVGNGHPGTIRVDDMIAVMDARSTQEMATMGSGRNRDETIDVDVVFSAYRGGTDQATVTARAFELLAALETSLRTDPTLGVTGARMAQVTDVALAEVVAQSEPGPGAPSRPIGRVAELAVTVNVIVRLT